MRDCMTWVKLKNHAHTHTHRQTHVSLEEFYSFCERVWDGDEEGGSERTLWINAKAKTRRPEFATMENFLANWQNSTPTSRKVGSSPWLWIVSHRISANRKITFSHSHRFSFAPMSFRRHARTSVHCAPAKRATDTRARHSTASFPTSCARAETSQITTAPVASRFMETNSRMRTSPWSTPGQASCQWLTLDPTLTDRNSSSPLSRRRGWTIVTSFSALSSKAWTSWRRSSRTEANRESRRRISPSPTRANFKRHHEIPPSPLLFLFLYANLSKKHLNDDRESVLISSREQTKVNCITSAHICTSQSDIIWQIVKAYVVELLK